MVRAMTNVHREEFKKSRREKKKRFRKERGV